MNAPHFRRIRPVRPTTVFIRGAGKGETHTATLVSESSIDESEIGILTSRGWHIIVLT